MTEAEATRWGVERRPLHFRIENGKSNLAPPPQGYAWCKLVPVELGNGDSVGVVTSWSCPDAFADVSVDDLRAVQERVQKGRWRENNQAKDWVGKTVADASVWM